MDAIFESLNSELHQADPMRAEIDVMSQTIAEMQHQAGAVCFGPLPHRLQHALKLRSAGVSVETFAASMEEYDLLKTAAGIASEVTA